MPQESLKATPQGITILKREINKQKLSRQALAGKVKKPGHEEQGISLQTIGKLLKGKAIARQYLVAICKALKVPLETVADLTDEIVEEILFLARPLIEQEAGTMRMFLVAHPVSVEEISVDLDVLENVSSRSFMNWQQGLDSRSDSSDRLGVNKIVKERLTALKVVEECPLLTIFGKPGSGKSTLCKKIAVSCLNSTLQWKKKPYIPVLIPLSTFADELLDKRCGTLLEAIQQEFTRWGAKLEKADKILQAGRALILLDGLDEVPDSQSDFIQREIRRFAKDYPQIRMVVTCRTQSLQSPLERFTEAEIADFTTQQVEEFIKKWFIQSVGNQSESEQFAQELLRQIHQNPQIAELTKTPVLLNLICCVFQDTRNILSETRANLYQHGISLLLKDWDAHKGINRNNNEDFLTLEEKEKLLGYLAKTLLENEGTIYQRDKVIKPISDCLSINSVAAESLLKSMEVQCGLIIERSKGYYSFLHLTFQEYLCAKEVIRQENDEENFSLLTDFIQEHLHNKRWEEVLLLLVGQLEGRKAAKVIQAILNKNSDYEQWIHRDLLFAGRCLTENPRELHHANNQLFEQIIEGLIELDALGPNEVGQTTYLIVFMTLCRFKNSGLEEQVIDFLEAKNQRIKLDYVRLLGYRIWLNVEKQAAITELISPIVEPSEETNQATELFIRDRVSQVLSALIEAGEKEVIRIAIRWSKSKNHIERAQAAQLLGSSNGSKLVIETLSNLFRDPEEEELTRISAIGALIKLRKENKEEAIDFSFSQLNNKTPILRFWGVNNLALIYHILNEQVIINLIKLMLENYTKHSAFQLWNYLVLNNKIDKKLIVKAHKKLSSEKNFEAPSPVKCYFLSWRIKSNKKASRLTILGLYNNFNSNDSVKHLWTAYTLLLIGKEHRNTALGVLEKLLGDRIDDVCYSAATILYSLFKKGKEEVFLKTLEFDAHNDNYFRAIVMPSLMADLRKDEMLPIIIDYLTKYRFSNQGILIDSLWNVV